MTAPENRSTAAERSLEVFPAGSNGEFNLPPRHNTVIAGGEGCELWDTEGRRFLDFSMGWGSSLVGHARPEVVAAVQRQAPLGSNFAYVTEKSLELAEEICRLSPACEQVRFCGSGSEAAMYCQRIARAYTKKAKVLKFEGAYHGAHEIGVTSLFPHRLKAFPAADPSSAGIPDAVARDILVAPYNDAEMVSKLIRRHASRLAAVIVEPLQRCTPPREGFLEALSQTCRDKGVLLIFDEVVTGFRLAYGGAQEYYGVVPDLVGYGKALGGGYPIGAFGGRRELMSLMREERLGQAGYVWMASTLGGNPISSAAALAALSIFRREETYTHLHQLGQYLRLGLEAMLAANRIEAQVVGDGPLAQVVFSDKPVYDYRSARRGNRKLARALMLALFQRGIFLNPMGTKLYLSLAHSRDTCDLFLERFEDALKAVVRDKVDGRR
jgi:glutamate-1-semialdehyde 2,1-aminomutase